MDDASTPDPERFEKRHWSLVCLTLTSCQQNLPARPQPSEIMYCIHTDGYMCALGPNKGITREFKDFVPICSVTFRVLKLTFLVFPGGPGGFRELREAYRKHFHLSLYL